MWSALTHTRWPPWHPARRRRSVDARRVRAVHGPPTPPHARLVRDACSFVALRRRHHLRSPRTDRHHRPLPSPLAVGQYPPPPTLRHHRRIHLAGHTCHRRGCTRVGTAFSTLFRYCPPLAVTLVSNADRSSLSSRTSVEGLSLNYICFCYAHTDTGMINEYFMLQYCT